MDTQYDSENIKTIISQGESTTVQFKVRVDDAYKAGTEMTAFSNTQGGLLVVGVDDKTGAVKKLSFEEIQATNALLANAASENVKPAIVIKTKTISVDGQNIVVAEISKGKDKPYKDNKGIIWVKNGSDKRKVFSNNELRVMMQSCGTLSADSDSVAGTSYKDIYEPTLKNFLFKRYTDELTNAGILGHLVQGFEIGDIVKVIDANFTVEKLLKNISLMNNAGQLTLSGLLLLGKSIQRYNPVFTVKGVSFVGSSVGTNEFRDKMPDREVEGNLLKQYEASISFINRNLRTVQVEKEFNSAGQLEVPLEVFVETLTNALIHRDYYINAPIRLFIFDDRIEIHSPGILPDSVTETNIMQGISVPRNKLLFDNAKHMLPYTGIGSGIVRAMKSYDKLLFRNNTTTEEFIITIMRDKPIEEKRAGCVRYTPGGLGTISIVADDGGGSSYKDDGVKREKKMVRYAAIKRRTKKRKDDFKDTFKGQNEGINRTFEGIKNDPTSEKKPDEGIKDDSTGTKTRNEGINRTFEGIKDDFKGTKEQNEGINCAFEGIKDDYTGSKTKNEGINEGINFIPEIIISERIKADLLSICLYLQKNELSKHVDIKRIINKSDATVERYLKMLKDNSLIEYAGSKKTGGYKIVSSRQ
ncbi:MAG: putative DNA binding domain-containing protein [Prevotellaceae bacterium]|jgi:predicted HTH transcriptional regulator|nr:putative DNA binding domain-containing protein [Prevotellaceae bacterium]